MSAAAALFPGIDRDIAVTGALLHDIGKTEAYNDDPLAIELTDAGRLHSEIPLGYYKVRRQIEDIDGFEADLAQAVLHIILSHHGALDHGSPVVPARARPRWCTRSTISAASWVASTASSVSCPTVRHGRASTVPWRALPSSARGPPSRAGPRNEVERQRHVRRPQGAATCSYLRAKRSKQRLTRAS